MASLTITIDDSVASEVIDVLAKSFDYQDIIANPNFDDQIAVDPITNPETITNPQSKGSFVKDKLIEFLKERYRTKKQQLLYEQDLTNIENTLSGSNIS